MASEVRRLAAIVVADVAGYSRLMGLDEAGTLTRLKAHRQADIDPALARHGGRVVKLMGDGMLAEFSSALAALTCAVEIQQAMAEANRALPAERRMDLRMGVHLGDVIVDGSDVYGDGINLAARLEAEAEAGGIVISRSVHEAIDGRIKATFADLGERELKNIERPVRAYAVRWQAEDWRPAAATASAGGNLQDWPHAAPALPDKPSIVVLPFQNMSGDPDQEYFVDGMVEEITTALSRMRWLFVIARNSAFTYKGRAFDLKQVGRELGVRYALEGSVRKAANRVRITAQLIDCSTGTHLWAERFDGSLEDIFELHDRVAMDVAGAVEPNLRNAEIERSLRKPTASLDAYDLCMRAWAALRDPMAENLELGLDLTRRALERDPKYPRALALRATFVMHSAERIGPGAIPEVLRLAQAALASIDDPDSICLAAMTIALTGGSIETALSAVQRAVALNPNGFHVLTHNGWVNCAAGNYDVAIDSFTRAMRVSPLDPTRGYSELGLANAYRDQGDAAAALAWAERAIQSLPHLSGGYRAAAVALVDLGRIDDAKAKIGELLAVLPQARIDAPFIRRQNRNEASAQAWVSALQRAGLPD